MKKRILSAILAAVMVLGMIIMPATAAEGKMPFTDVKSGKWYYEAVEYVWKNDLMNGMTDTTFEPNTAMNRGMLVTVLWRVEGSPEPTGTTPFTDLKKNYYKKAVAWAYENDIVNGITTTTFAPEDPITREQIATIFFRYAKNAGRDVTAKGDLSKFPDGSKVAKYAKDAMTWAVGEGLISGTKIDGKDYLDPKGKATRAQVATILMRYLESAKDPMYDKIDDILTTIPCDAHGKIDVYFGPGDTLTEENMNAFLTGLFDLGEGYTVAIDSDSFAEIKTGYSGAGDGDGGWYDGIPVTFTNTATGETTTEEIDIDIVKNLNAQWSGAMDNYALTYCWDDVPQIAKTAMDNLAELNDGDVLLEGEEYTPEIVEAYLREKSGLTDAGEWEFFLGRFDAEKKYEGNEVCAAFKNVVDGRACIVGIGVTFKVESSSVVDPMHAAFEEFLDEYLCATHGALTTMHNGGGNFNATNVATLALETMGLDAETYSVVVNGEIKDPGLDIGQFAGADNVEIYVKNNVTGEETEHETISLSSRKLNHVSDVSTMCLYTCPEDSEVWKPAEETLGALYCTDGSHEDPIIHALFPDEASFTEENFAAVVKAAVADIDGAEVFVTKFDAARLNTESTCRVYIYKWNDKVLEATNEISFLCSTASVDAPVLSAEHPVPPVLDPTPDNIGVAYEGETSGIKISYAKLFEENGAAITAAGGVGAHGGHETRIVRTENGTYATYITTATGESSEEHPLWFQGVATFSVVKITADGFHVIFTDEFPQAAGSCTPNVINAGDGKVYVTIICDDKDRYMSTMGTDEFTNGVWLAVYEIDTATDTVTAPEAPTLIDHETTPFQDHGYGYTQPILDKEHGKLYAVTCGGEAPGYIAWFIYDLETKTWDPECYTVELFTRRCYINGYPDGKGGFTMVIERCAPVTALKEALGFDFQQTSGYVWDALYLMHIADPTVEEVTVDTVICEPHYTAEGYKGNGRNRFDNATHYGTGGCTYLDTEGKLHVIYSQSVGNEGKTTVYNAIYDLEGNELYKNALPTTLVPKNGGRPSYSGFAMTQGPDGTFYVFFFYGSSATTMDVWKSSTDGRTFTKIADVSGIGITDANGTALKIEKPIIGNSRNFSVRDGIIPIMMHGSGSGGNDNYYYFSIEVPGYEG